MAFAEKVKKVEEQGKAGPGRAVKNGKGGLVAKAAGGGTGRKTVAELVDAAALIIDTQRAATKKRKRRSSKDGAEMLKQASDQALVEITGDIVEKLKDGAKEGKVVCVKALMTFSEKKKPRAKRKKYGPSLAEQLANERQWEGEPDYGDEEGGEMQGFERQGSGISHPSEQRPLAGDPARYVRD